MNSALPTAPRSRARRWLFWSATLAVVIAGAGIYWLGAGQRSVTAALRLVRYDEAVAAIDLLYEAHPHQPGTSSGYPAPAPLSAIASEVRLTDEGAYLRTHRSFVEEDGIFILRRDTTFQPLPGGDPSFERVRDRLFRYHISG